MIDDASLHARVPDGAERTFCSWHAGWRNVLLREYVDPPEVESFRTTPTPDQKVVLVVAGTCMMEAQHQGAWRGTTYRSGHIGLIAPGKAAHLRWRGQGPHRTVQMHLPGKMISHVAEDLFGSRRTVEGLLDELSLVDSAVEEVMLALLRAAKAGAPDLHAETTAHFLTSHLLLRASRGADGLSPGPDEAVLRRVSDYMRSHLASDLSLEELANVAGIGRFRLLRLATRVWGESPIRYLTRIRMERARQIQVSRRLSVIEVALECGYSNPAHFATAFKRHYRASPSEIRRNTYGPSVVE